MAYCMCRKFVFSWHNTKREQEAGKPTWHKPAGTRPPKSAVVTSKPSSNSYGPLTSTEFWPEMGNWTEMRVAHSVGKKYMKQCCGLYRGWYRATCRIIEVLNITLRQKINKLTNWKCWCCELCRGLVQTNIFLRLAHTSFTYKMVTSKCLAATNRNTFHDQRQSMQPSSICRPPGPHSRLLYN